ncbi:MlaD family protein [Nocardia farcinica]|uniref:MlaD family protein n=1 Tax=Nocardia farcinica TaxID=37329 RepID=UPI002159AD67|nr:MlaD family protein [Nocardia farcinica]
MSMARHINQDFIRGDRDRQLRVLAICGGAAAVAVLLVVTVGAWAYTQLTAPQGIRLQLVLPALGPGVEPGSKVLVRGAAVGEVTEVAAVDSGTAHVALVLDDELGAILTDSLDVDFRPENYFGVTAVNLIERPGGNALTDGRVLHRTAAPDYTMSTMLEQVSLVVDGTLTSSMIATLDEIMRYANGLAPLIRAGIIVAEQMSKTQQHLPTELLLRANDVLVQLPAFGRGAADALYAIYHSAYNQRPDGSLGVDDAFMTETDQALELAASDLFGLAGSLLASHDAELIPLVGAVDEVVAPLPGLLGDGRMAELNTAIDRLESAFAGTPEQRTLRLRVVLDDVPGLAGPLAQLGALPAPSQAVR